MWQYSPSLEENVIKRGATADNHADFDSFTAANRN
jgi:hypothetical protein